MRTAWILVALAGASSCFSDCTEQVGPTGGGGGSDLRSYSLVEATGRWSITANHDTGAGCSNATTSSEITLTLPAVKPGAASWLPNSGFFSASADVTLAFPGSSGTTTCPSQPPRACPESAQSAFTVPGFMLFEAEIPAGAPSGLAFVPRILSTPFLELCDHAQFSISTAGERGRPITVAELESGRFVIESQGSSRVTPQLPDDATAPPQALTGTYTWAYRFVFQTADFDPSKAVTPPTFTSFDQCLLDIEPTIDDLEAAETAYASGATEIAFNASGCQRLYVSRVGGVETQRFRVTRGTRLTLDATTGMTTSGRDEVTTWERVIEPGLERERFDSDRDGLFEIAGETLFQSGAWQASTLRELVPGTNTVLRQVTQTRVDATTMSVHLEEAGVGTQEDFVTTLIQEACFDRNSPTAPACSPAPPTGLPPTCVVGPTNCSATQLRDIKGKLAAALAQGSASMARAMGSSPDLRGKALTMVATGDLHFACSRNPCDAYGSYDVATKTMMINTARLGGNPVQLSRTLFHEMLHSDGRFAHNDLKNDIAKKACKLQIIDRTYACEVMAFGPQATECVCNRCLTPDGVEPRVPTCEYCRQHFPPCLGRQETKPDGGTGNVAQAVGAWCSRLKVFCDTATECDAECAPIGGRCERNKSVCDRNCN